MSELTQSLNTSWKNIYNSSKVNGWFSLMCKQFLQISKKQTNNSVEKWAKDIYGDSQKW